MRVSQADTSPAFAPAFSLMTLLCVALWILSSLANAQTRGQFISAAVAVLFVPLLLVLAALVFPFMRGIVGLLGRLLLLVFGVAVLGGIGVVHGAHGAVAGGRGRPRDLLIEVEDASTSEHAMVRFARASADVVLPAGTKIAAEGKIRGTTLLTERVDVETGLGFVPAKSGGAVAKGLGYLGLTLFALLALTATVALLR